MQYECDKCDAQLEAHDIYKITRNFLNLRRFRCPDCEQIVTLPMTNGFRIAVIVLAVLFALALVFSLLSDEPTFAGVIWSLTFLGLCVMSLVVDATVRARWTDRARSRQ